MTSTVHTLTVNVPCRRCQTVTALTVDPDAFAAWQRREKLAQDAFPHLTVAERELLISATCGTCWTELFGDEDD